MYIYKITNLINNKVYIGQTIQSIEHRWLTHKGKWSGCLALSNAIRKYGEANFKVEQIDTGDSIDDLNKKEIQYIKDFNSLAPNGYNLMSGGDNSKHSEESIEKMVKSSKGQKPWNKGLTKDDPRVRKYMRKGSKSHLYGKPGLRKGVGLSEATRSKISKVQLGKKHSLNTKEKMSKSHKRVVVICVNNGLEYSSIRQAARDLGINSGNICNVLKGRLKHTQGYVFKHKE